MMRGWRIASKPASIPASGIAGDSATKLGSEVDILNRRFYRPELDALRFAAFLLVFVHHIIPERPVSLSFASRFISLIGRSMGFGLSLFFILSAYLLTTLLLREKSNNGRIGMKAFYLRRCLRIWPLYYLALLTSFMTTRIAMPRTETRIFATYAAMIGNFGDWIGVSGTRVALQIGHLWSISVEEQFYLLIPALVLVLSRRQLGAFAWALAIVSLASTGYAVHVGIDPNLIWRFTLSQGVMFAAGILIAVHIDHDGLHIHGALFITLIALAGTLMIAAEGLGRIQDDAVPPTALSAIIGYAGFALAGALVIAVLLGKGHHVPGWARYLGKISYGLYVFHAWALQLAEVVTDRFSAGHLAKDGLALALTVALAALSYQFLEEPFLNLKRRFEIIKTGD